MSANMNGKHNENEEPTSQSELADFIRRFEDLERDYSDIVDSFDKQSLQWRSQMAGQHLDSFLQNKDETIKRFEDSDPKLRQVAIHVAVHHWKCCDRIAHKCEKMAASDPDPDVRSMAITALGLCFSKTKEKRLGRMLAVIVQDQNELEKIRKSAYLSLLALHGRDQSRNLPGVPQRFPEDVNWSLVEMYFGEEKGEEKGTA